MPEPHGGQSIGPVTTANGVVYVGSLNGFMYALDAATGAKLWEFQGAGSSNAGPAIVDGKLYWGNGYDSGGNPSTTFYAFALPGGGPSSQPPSSPPSSPPPTSTSPTTSPTTSPAGVCSASYQLVNQWPGGFQGEVTVRAGNSAVNGWTVGWTFPNGQTVTQIWNGSATTSGSSVTVRNAVYNGTLAANGTTSFGFLGAWNGSNTAPATLTCASP